MVKSKTKPDMQRFHVGRTEDRSFHLKKLTRTERKRLMNLTPKDIELPDYAVLTFAVCALDADACGWGGWLSEGAFIMVPDGSGILQNGDNPLPSVTAQICPNCGRTLFRNDTAQVFELSRLASRELKSRSFS